MKNLVCAGFVIGAVSVILGIIARIGAGFLMSVASATYLDFANTVFLGAITLGVSALLSSRGGS